MRQFLVIFTFLFSFNFSLKAQKPEAPNSAELYNSLQKLNFLGSALYIAAHPDDENTRFISFLSNALHARTGYLSLTRGDGGQNLIGSELRELLGVLRTQELLAARRVDGGEQYFTRANDFGYSKHPDETLEIWNKDAVLADVVWAIRNFKPDIIINRFDHRSPGSTHGHHTASAMLSVEAFDLAGSRNAYTSQLNKTEIWQPKRLFFNTSWWFYGSEEKFENADKSNMLSVDVGQYYPVLGVSNNEIASTASSQHLSQGFGRVSQRGTQPEYIELLKGDLPADKSNMFDGINTSWSRLKGGQAIGSILNSVEKNFNFKDPVQHLPDLIKAYNLLQNVEDNYWKTIKLPQLMGLIEHVAGLYLEASAGSSSTYPGGQVQVQVEAINRSAVPMTLRSITVSNVEVSQSVNKPLQANIKQNFDLTIKVPARAKYTTPYWLTEKGSLGMYAVSNQDLIGKPETPGAFEVSFKIEVEGHTIHFTKPLLFHYAKPEKGELYQPFEVLPKATASFLDRVLLFSDGKPKEIPVVVRANADGVNGVIALRSGEGWQVKGGSKNFDIENKGDKKVVFFTVTPPAKENEGMISAIINLEGAKIDKSLVQIAYDHIPDQSVLLPAEAKAVRLDIKTAGKTIGYVAGAGDKVPESLRQIGYQVTIITPSSITAGSLTKYDAVLMGIRAYNVIDELKFKQKFLFDYVKQGGTMVVQYNTAGRWSDQFKNIAPFDLELSRDRVTDENAAVTIVAKNHPLVNYPNKISASDFNGWVQERGLYFPSSWADEFTPILSMSDANEKPTKGSLLVAAYGKGHYVYTGLSFFRELPAGVPGAYKLFANMLSIGQENQPITIEQEKKP